MKYTFIVALFKFDTKKKKKLGFPIISPGGRVKCI